MIRGAALVGSRRGSEVERAVGTSLAMRLPLNRIRRVRRRRAECATPRASTATSGHIGHVKHCSGVFHSGFERPSVKNFGFWYKRSTDRYERH